MRINKVVPVEKAGQKTSHLSFVIVELFGYFQCAHGHDCSHGEQRHGTEKQRDYPVSFFIALIIFLKDVFDDENDLGFATTATKNILGPFLVYVVLVVDNYRLY